MIAGRFADLQVLGLQEGLSDLAGDGGAISLFGLWGGARALVLGEIARALKRPLVVVTPTLREAEEVTADLRFFLDRDQVNLFPEPEVPPFQPVSPPLEIRAERMQRLRELRDEELKALVLPIHALFRRFLPPDALDSATVRLYPHRIVPPEQVVELLEVGGYRSVPQVEQAGEYSRRGGILDIGLSHLLHPVRIEFFGDEIESIRTFDVGTQRSLSGSRRVDGVTIFPLSEVLLSAESRGLARRRTAGQAPPLVQEAVEMARSGPGVERYLPYFHRHIVPLWEYFSPGTILVWDDPDQVMAKAEATHALLLEEYKRHKAEGLPPLTATHLRWKEIHATLASRPRIDLFPFSPPPGEQGAPFVFETKRAPSYQGRFTPWYVISGSGVERDVPSAWWPGGRPRPSAFVRSFASMTSGRPSPTGLPPPEGSISLKGDSALASTLRRSSRPISRRPRFSARVGGSPFGGQRFDNPALSTHSRI
ncbi:MAG: hypothetical protein IH782_03625 [candidate division NC10 bacterium]|nr:hypothetical protein [candidate division NC10 bacterium]